jgi:hypothetical protein
MPKTLILFLFLIAVSCNRKTQLKKQLNSDFKSNYWFAKDTSIAIYYVSDASFGYHFCYPQSFKDSTAINLKHPIEGDTSTMMSPQKNAIIKVWTGESISCPQADIDFSIPYDSIFGYRMKEIKGEDIRIENLFEKTYKKALKLVPSELKGYSVKKHYINKKRLFFAIYATKNGNAMIYASTLQVIPVSGDQAYSFITFNYPIKLKKEFEPIASDLLNCFSDK